MSTSKQTRNPSTPVSHYRVLGLTTHSTYEEVRAAWKAKARATHPDLNPGKDEEFKAASAAWAVLGNAKNRMSYNALMRITNACTRCDGSQMVAKSVSITKREYKPCPNCAK